MNDQVRALQEALRATEVELKHQRDKNAGLQKSNDRLLKLRHIDSKIGVLAERFHEFHQEKDKRFRELDVHFQRFHQEIKDVNELHREQIVNLKDAHGAELDGLRQQLRQSKESVENLLGNLHSTKGIFEDTMANLKRNLIINGADIDAKIEGIFAHDGIFSPDGRWLNFDHINDPNVRPLVTEIVNKLETLIKYDYEIVQTERAVHARRPDIERLADVVRKNTVIDEALRFAHEQRAHENVAQILKAINEKSEDAPKMLSGLVATYEREIFDLSKIMLRNEREIKEYYDFESRTLAEMENGTWGEVQRDIDSRLLQILEEIERLQNTNVESPFRTLAEHFAKQMNEERYRNIENARNAPPGAMRDASIRKMIRDYEEEIRALEELTLEHAINNMFVQLADTVEDGGVAADIMNRIQEEMIFLRQGRRELDVNHEFKISKNTDRLLTNRSAQLNDLEQLLDNYGNRLTNLYANIIKHLAENGPLDRYISTVDDAPPLGEIINPNSERPFTWRSTADEREFDRMRSNYENQIQDLTNQLNGTCLPRGAGGPYVRGVQEIGGPHPGVSHVDQMGNSYFPGAHHQQVIDEGGVPLGSRVIREYPGEIERRFVQENPPTVVTREVPTVVVKEIPKIIHRTVEVEVPGPEITRTVIEKQEPTVITREVPIVVVKEIPKIIHRTVEVPGPEIERTIIEQVPPQVITRTVEVPKIIERTVEVPKIVERTVEVPQFVTRTVEVPQFVTRTIEVPRVVTRTIEVPQIIKEIETIVEERPVVQTRVIEKEVPKIITREVIVIKEIPPKIIEVPKIIYRETTIEIPRIVTRIEEVPTIVTQERFPEENIRDHVVVQEVLMDEQRRAMEELADRTGFFENRIQEVNAKCAERLALIESEYGARENGFIGELESRQREIQDLHGYLNATQVRMNEMEDRHQREIDICRAQGYDVDQSICQEGPNANMVGMVWQAELDALKEEFVRKERLLLDQIQELEQLFEANIEDLEWKVRDLDEQHRAENEKMRQQEATLESALMQVHDQLRSEIHGIEHDVAQQVHMNMENVHEAQAYTADIQNRVDQAESLLCSMRNLADEAEMGPATTTVIMEEGPQIVQQIYQPPPVPLAAVTQIYHAPPPPPPPMFVPRPPMFVSRPPIVQQTFVPVPPPLSSMYDLPPPSRDPRDFIFNPPPPPVSEVTPKKPETTEPITPMTEVVTPKTVDTQKTEVRRKKIDEEVSKIVQKEVEEPTEDARTDLEIKIDADIQKMEEEVRNEESGGTRKKKIKRRRRRASLDIDAMEAKIRERRKRKETERAERKQKVSMDIDAMEAKIKARREAAIEKEVQDVVEKAKSDEPAPSRKMKKVRRRKKRPTLDVDAMEAAIRARKARGKDERTEQIDKKLDDLLENRPSPSSTQTRELRRNKNRQQQLLSKK